MSAALALSLAAACLLYAHRRGDGVGPDKSPSKDPNHFGIARYEPWGRSISSLPMSYVVPNCSLSSTSSSFRDYRFVNVYGPDGASIPQFNPNTAGAVGESPELPLLAADMVPVLFGLRCSSSSSD